VVATLAAFIPLTTLAELVNIGTLFAFVLVSLGVIVLRRTRPDLPRTFRTPWVPVLPLLSVAACLYLMLSLPAATWWRFFLWMLVGLVVYSFYGRRRSRVTAGGPYPGPAGREAAGVSERAAAATGEQADIRSPSV
jgi:APA family basic amino acid/polyamine antiporter